MITALLLVLAQAAAVTPAPATPTPATKLGGGFNQPKQTAGKARVVITDATLAPTGRGGTLSVSGTRTTPTVGTPAPGIPEPPPADDENGLADPRNDSPRGSLVKAEADYEAASAANTVVAWGNTGRDYETLMAIRNAALSPYRTKSAAIRRELNSLPEECRRTSGCQPGWVR